MLLRIVFSDALLLGPCACRPSGEPTSEPTSELAGELESGLVKGLARGLESNLELVDPDDHGPDSLELLAVGLFSMVLPQPWVTNILYYCDGACVRVYVADSLVGRPNYPLRVYAYG